jgi:peptide-methionine (S)-S-oxide reductase
VKRATIEEPHLRAAVQGIHAGDIAALTAILDADPEAIGEPATIAGEEGEVASGYFRQPRLLWFVANNPVLVDALPSNIVAVTQTLLAHGPAQGDRDYALRLVMTGRAAREQGLQRPLMRALLDGGARPSHETIVAAAAEKELDALRMLLDDGRPMTATIAAALGDDDALAALLKYASRDERHAAFGVAVINGRLDAARTTLAAGAKVNARLPVHAHATALHQAAFDGDLPLIALLLEHGAQRDTRDTLWDGTPRDWALYADRAAAAAALAG